MTKSEDESRQRIQGLIALFGEVLADQDLPGLEAVFLYGSSLGPFFRSDSDIDVALLDCQERPLTWSEQARLMDRFERASGHGVDLRILRECTLPHQVHVLQQGILVWAKDPAQVERYAHEALAASRPSSERSSRQWPEVLDRLAQLAAPR